MAPHQIAGAVEAVLRELSRVVFGHAVVAAQRVRTSHRQLSDHSVWDLAPFLIGEPHLVVRTDRRSHSLEAHVLGVVASHEEQRPFAHPEVLLDEPIAKGLRHSTSYLRLEALSA